MYGLYGKMTIYGHHSTESIHFKIMVIFLYTLYIFVEFKSVAKQKRTLHIDKNSAEGVIAPAGAKVTGATIRMWLLNKSISFLAVLSWKTGLKKMRTKCLVGHIYSRPVPFPLMAISSALTFRIIQPNDNGTST